MALKKVLVVLPVEQSHKDYFTARTAGRCEFVYRAPAGLENADLSDISAIVGNVPPAIVKKAPKLELLQLNSAGVDGYTVKGAVPEACHLCNAKGAYGLAVGEHMLALTFSLIRHLAQYRDLQQKREWRDCGRIISVEGSTVLVLGLGDIGGFYASKMKALGAKTVIGVRRSNRDKPDYLDEQYTLDKLDELLPRADITAMVMPGGDATSHLMDERRLKLMKAGSYLINVGRGSAIDPMALTEVLVSGHLGGAALDVTEPEPLESSSPLWGIKNLIITPHVAGNYFLQETFERVVRIAGDNLDAWLSGGALKNEVDREHGY